MIEIPKFKLYGDDDPEIQAKLKPDLGLRAWGNLNKQEKEIALREFFNECWFPWKELWLIETLIYLNHHYLAECPAPDLHACGGNYAGSLKDDHLNCAKKNFKEIFLYYQEEMVLLMLSVFAKKHINYVKLERAIECFEPDKKKELLDDSYIDLLAFAAKLNHIFEQFSLNIRLTRVGFIPYQDEKITAKIYEPTLKLLSDPKWNNLNEDLSGMFDDFQKHNYSEVITKAHSAVHRFLQILIGEEGKSGKGEVGKLLSDAKKNGLIPQDRFSEPLLQVITSFIPSERANNSTAKPTLKLATESDALLMMNVIMVLFQHILKQNI